MVMYRITLIGSVSFCCPEENSSFFFPFPELSDWLKQQEKLFVVCILTLDHLINSLTLTTQKDKVV